MRHVDTRSSGPNPYANYAVARLKESLPAGSYIGVMGIDKRSGNIQDRFNQLVASIPVSSSSRTGSLTPTWRERALPEVRAGRATWGPRSRIGQTGWTGSSNGVRSAQTLIRK